MYDIRKSKSLKHRSERIRERLLKLKHKLEEELEDIGDYDSKKCSA